MVAQNHLLVQEKSCIIGHCGDQVFSQVPRIACSWYFWCRLCYRRWVYSLSALYRLYSMSYFHYIPFLCILEHLWEVFRASSAYLATSLLRLESGLCSARSWLWEVLAKLGASAHRQTFPSSQEESWSWLLGIDQIKRKHVQSEQWSIRWWKTRFISGSICDVLEGSDAHHDLTVEPLSKLPGSKKGSLRIVFCVHHTQDMMPTVVPISGADGSDKEYIA